VVAATISNMGSGTRKARTYPAIAAFMAALTCLFFDLKAAFAQIDRLML
jgi:hypothetical protein